jgi:DNA-binding response OmpR family regulator
LVSALASLKVCIVDADGEMRQMIRDALTSLGISQIRECADSDMAQQLIGEFDPDLCIYDWETGPIDGITFVRNVRASESDRQSEMRLIMITGKSNTRRVMDARNAGVDEFLVKPISLRALHGRLMSLVDNPRLFVRTPAYTGPDRRRQSRPFAGNDRRGTDGGEENEQSSDSANEPLTTEIPR